MKKILVSIMTLTLLMGCASLPDAQDQIPVENQRAIAVFESVNKQIFGDIWKPGESMADFKLVQFKALLSSYKSSRALELQEILESYDTQILRGFEKTFVFCVFSSKQGFAMCDDARCSGVEKKSSANSPEVLESWWKDLPLTNCPQH
jgi:hypothetical protein